jgi:ATP adenylyltransferase
MEFLTDPKAVAKPGECVFCALLAEDSDRKNLILHRGEEAFVILNKYPYNNGHLMIVPNRHTADYASLTDKELDEMGRLSKHVVTALTKSYSPQGFNMGMNLGAAAGAGIREHLHLHVVPRWVGDTNFMPVIAETKAMPQHLMSSYDQLYSFFENL